MEKRAELLAPCGSYESFLAAVNAGADAVYLGGRQFGARAYAENFGEEELICAIKQAHLAGVKVYLTVNTLVKEREFSKLFGYLLPLCEAGLSGAIVQDMGVLAFLRRTFPDLKIHASTQTTVTGVYGAAYLKEMGCGRIVPARELSLEEIREIKRQVPVEIEAFVHGAMCYCYSGQCLMSSMIGGRSGNRGRCAGPCRLPYRVAGKEGYYLSLKDMNTLECLPELIEAGIDSFKVEGRMKRPEYVAGVVSIYRKYIDRYYDKSALRDATEGGFGGKPDPERTSGRHFAVEEKDRKMLSDLYIRGGTGTGYYFQKNGKDMLALRKPGYNEPDQALLGKLREQYVRELPEIEDCGEGKAGAETPGAQAGQTDAAKESRQKKWSKQAGRELSLTVCAQTCDQAEKLLAVMGNREMQKDRGELPGWEDVSADAAREFLVVDADLLLENQKLLHRISACKVRWGIKCPVILRKSDGKFLEKLRRVIEERKPDIVYCATIDVFAWLKSISYTGRIAGEASLYAWNAEAVSFWRGELHRISIPLELNSREIRELCAAIQDIDQIGQNEAALMEKLEAPVYGRVPFMVSANCVKLSAGKCDKNRKQYAELTDRKGNIFPVYTDCSHCYNVIYNCLPNSCAEDLWMLLEDGIRAFRVEFTTEGGGEAARILQTFRGLLETGQKKKGKSPIGGTTRGRFRLGVE